MRMMAINFYWKRPFLDPLAELYVSENVLAKLELDPNQLYCKGYLLPHCLRHCHSPVFYSLYDILLCLTPTLLLGGKDFLTRQIQSTQLILLQTVLIYRLDQTH